MCVNITLGKGLGVFLVLELVLKVIPGLSPKIESV